MTGSNTVDLPSALEEFAAIKADLGSRRLAVFLDYDGTLTPIVDTPEQALLTNSMSQSLQRLGEHCVLAIVSGRAMANVRDKVKLDDLSYAGDHGFEILTSDGKTIQLDEGEAFIEQVQSASAALAERIRDIPGAQVEPKKYSLSVHYRLTPSEDVPAVEAAVDAVLRDHDKLNKRDGKMVFELRPKIDWHKGKAVMWLLEALQLGDDVLPLYIGDDSTDEDAFRALADSGRGYGILVAEQPLPSAARYRVRDVTEVQRFLEQLADLAGGK